MKSRKAVSSQKSSASLTAAEKKRTLFVTIRFFS